MRSVPADDIPNGVWDLIEAAVRDCGLGVDQPGRNPYALPEAMLSVLLVTKVQGMIDKENLDFFFENDWPENPPYSLFSDAFRRIGVTEAADCIEDAVSMFPSPLRIWIANCVGGSWSQKNRRAEVKVH